MMSMISGRFLVPLHPLGFGDNTNAAFRHTRLFRPRARENASEPSSKGARIPTSLSQVSWTCLQRSPSTTGFATFF